MRSLKQLSDLTGRVALVTGGAGHIGFAAAQALAELGAMVAVSDLSPEACVARAGELRGTGYAAAFAAPCDLADEAATRKMVQDVMATQGRLDILVHSAAFVGTTRLKGWAAPFEQQTVEAWDLGLRVNLTSAFVLAQEARAALEQSGKGSIVFVGSISGMVGPDMTLYEGTSMSKAAAYAASKGGLLQLTRHLSTLLAPAVRVNMFSPGGIERGQPEVFQQRYVDRTPLKRMGTEEDMKGAIAYLASDLSAYVTGQNIAVDGGWSVW
jgi:NAD(P)-dependent dehydrogenase (short-subunit alcohol dehydrogenase family)